MSRVTLVLSVVLVAASARRISPPSLPKLLVDTNVPAELSPVTVKDANVPTEVMLGCALVVNVPVK